MLLVVAFRKGQGMKFHFARGSLAHWAVRTFARSAKYCASATVLALAGAFLASAAAQPLTPAVALVANPTPSSLGQDVLLSVNVWFGLRAAGSS
jgi:hypothetical protein